jgi:hypothetical protein
MINSVAAGKNYRRMRLNINLLLTEIFGRNGLKPDEGMEVQFYIILSTQLKIRRLLALGPRLGNQYFFFVFGQCAGFNPLFYHSAVRLIVAQI